MTVRKTIIVNSEDWRRFRMKLIQTNESVNQKIKEWIREYIKDAPELKNDHF